MEQTLLLIQGIYFLVTGIWPVLHRRSFEAVTGPKTDWWLVCCVGLLAAASGAVFVHSSRTAPVAHEIASLAMLDAAAFAAIDFRYALIGRISRVYLLDGGIEVAFIIGWLLLR
jgi:hypothetical protein